MCRHAAKFGAVLAVLMAVLTPSAEAEITSIAGYAQAAVTEYRSGSEGDTDQATESFPGTAAELPLQVVARLLSSEFAAGDPNEEAAAAVAAQFADPRDLLQPNPEEFAINLALNSISPNIRYQGQAISRETRGVVFSPTEIGPFATAGNVVPVTSRLFLDGALTLMAIDPDKDLTGAYVRLTVTVVQSEEGQEDRTVFEGSIELRGSTGGDATLVPGGHFPTARLIRTDLSILSEDFAAFHVLIIPNITIDYPYSATVGQPFTLEATVQVDAANVAGEAGVAAVIGTPTDTLNQVIGLTQGDEVAAKTLTLLDNERENPSGELAFPQSPVLLPACALFGFESLIGTALLIGFIGFGPRRFCRRS